MPNRKLYALLCGVNDYTPNVGSLHGCLNDVDHYECWLNERFPADQSSIVVLKDRQATRNGIIDGFREHLAQAGSDDLVLFQFAGHGARWKSAPEFLSYYPDGFDEGLVCWDSRRDPTAQGSYDLADKELAVLISEVAARCQHVVVLLDCCHSGSGTRSADDLAQMAVRLTHQVDTPRPLESYLNGHYLQLQETQGDLQTTASRHILLAACERKKQAFEGYDRRGVFSSTLLECLDRCAGNTSYADLFLKVRASVQRKAYNQTPQFEVFRGFDGHQGFLGSTVDRSKTPRYRVRQDVASQAWTIDFGSLHGFVPIQDKPLEFVVCSASSQLSQPQTSTSVPQSTETQSSGISEVLGRAVATNVGLTKCTVELEFDPTGKRNMFAEVTSLPCCPLLVAILGDHNALELLHTQLNSASLNTVQLVEDTDHFGGYVVEAVCHPQHGSVFLIHDRATGRLVQGVRGFDELAARHVIRSLAHLAEWESRRQLRNSQSRISPGVIPFNFVQQLEGDSKLHEGSKIQFAIEGDSEIRGKLVTKNSTGQQLYSLLVYFSDDYSMTVLDNDEFPDSPQERTILLDGSPNLELFLDSDEHGSVKERFMLIVSSQPIDDFMLKQREGTSSNVILEPLERGIVDPIRDRKIRTGQGKIGQIDWFTKTLEIELVRQGDRTGSNGLKIPETPIFIHPHPTFEANLRLQSVQSASRSAGQIEFWRTLCSPNLSLMNFASSRGESVSVLELSGFQRLETLKQQPLKIEIADRLPEDESIIALTYDGEKVLTVGETTRNGAGNTVISIAEFPERVGEQSRSVASTIKLYLFKTYFKVSNVNQLRSVEFGENCEVVLDRYAVADHVSKANRVVVLIHGLLGDGASMAKDLHPSMGLPISQMLEIGQPGTVVLTWDYEHLSSTLQSSAKELRDRLKSIGIGAQDAKQLTMVGHSIGGLVARWLVEQEDGKNYVDELHLLGVPNGGAPIGKIGFAVTAAKLLITVGINLIPGVSGIASTLLTALLNISRFTTALEQLDPDGDFLQQLNGSADPQIRYVLYAGDVTKAGKNQNAISKLVQNIGNSKLAELIFDNAAHDMLVSSGSARNISSSRSPQPQLVNVECHHFDYLRSIPAAE